MDIFVSPLQGIQERLKEQLHSSVPLLQELVDYAFEKPGKNIRSRLMIALCYDYGFDPQKAHLQNIAAAIELIHAATLFHDDVIDESAERRHRPTVPMAYSNTCSILLGDYCFSKAYMLLRDLPGKHDFFEKISQTAQDLIEGEVWQYQLQSEEITLDQYYRIIELKTARLFELATSSLCLLCPEKFPEDLTLFGRNFGILFQLMDDYFDYFRSREGGAKPPGKDFEEKKMTLPVILALGQEIIPSVQSFLDKKQDFNDFLTLLTPAEPLCRRLITKKYGTLLQTIGSESMTGVVMGQAFEAFIPKEISESYSV